MKKRKIELVLVACLILLFGCKKVTFLPIQGDVEGYITDNNGQPVSGATVSATFEAPTQYGPAEDQNKSTTTDSDGYYHLKDLWDEILLHVDHSGLEPTTTLIKLSGKERFLQVDLALNGSPTISRVTFEKTILSIDSLLQDSILFEVEVEDSYNNQFGDYQCNLKLEDSAGNTRRIVSATVKEQSLKRVLLAGVVTAGKLQAGSYLVNAEVIDPDGNSHLAPSVEIISIE